VFWPVIPAAVIKALVAFGEHFAGAIAVAFAAAVVGALDFFRIVVKGSLEAKQQPVF